MISRDEVRRALSGPIMSLSTPFLADGEIDYEGVRRIIDYTIEEGASKAVVLTSGDGLFTVMSDEEVAQLTKVVIEHTRGRAMVVAADNYWWTGQAIEFAKYVRKLGADILMIRPPDWAKSCTVATMIEHYAAVADQEIPLMLVSNVFAERDLAFSMEVLERLKAQVKGIYAVKDDLCGEFGRKLALLVHEQWGVFASGSKQATANAMPYGLDGYLSIFILFKPNVAHEFFEALLGNDWDKVKKIINERDVPFWDYITNSPGGVDAPVHGILELKGLAQRWRRKPTILSTMRKWNI